MEDYSLLIAVIAGIGILLLLILYVKIQAFLSLLIASISVGLLAGMPPTEIIQNVQKGMGGTLGFIAVVIGLGAIFGAMLESSGGVQSLAAFILKKTGEKRASWALAAVGFLASIPVFFDVAFVILVPVVYALQKKTGKSLLYYGIPLLTGLAVTHAFIPPTPGPVAVAEILGANLGLVIIAGFLAGIPATIISGPLFSSYIAKHIHVEAPESFTETEDNSISLPSPGTIAALLGLPLLLIILNTYLESPFSATLPIPRRIKETIQMLGHPFVALIIANLLAWYLLGVRKGLSRNKLQEISTNSLGPAGLIILITGAGGVFKQILTETGAGQMLAEVMISNGLSVFLFAYLSAVAIRIIQGSSTVAMITAAGMTAAFLEEGVYTSVQKSLLVITIASGASILSHVNDSGFWLVSKYFALTERQTLLSWSVMTTILSITGFIVMLVLNYIL